MRRFGNALANTGDMLLQHALRLKQQQEQSELVRQRQQELADFQNQFRKGQAEDTRRQQTLDKILGDPTGGVAQTLVDAGETEWSPFAPKPEKALAGVGADIEKFTKREELPTDVGLEPMLASRPGGRMAAKDPTAIETLMAQRNSRRGSLDQLEQQKIAESADKSRQDAYASGMGTATAAHEMAPTVTADKVAQEKALTPVMASRAGAEAGARARATNAAEIEQLTNPKYLAAVAEKIKQEGMAKALATRSQDHAAMVNDAATAIASITPDWERMKILSQTVNTGVAAQVGRYYVGSKLQLDKNATELDSIGQNLAKRLANNALLGGNKGAQSEKDSEAIANRLPNSYDSKESAERKVLAFENNMLQGLKAMSELPAHATPQEKINKMRESIGLPPVDLSHPGGLPQDPRLEEAERRLNLMLGTQMPPMRPQPTHRNQ
jgi:hypothetical protein